MIGRSLRLTVVGDAFLDVDILGVTREPNPFATPVLDVGRRLRRAGGAGLVASMLRDDGHEVTLLTAIGDDQSAASVVAQLEGVNVVAGELRSRTPVKTRLFEGSEVIGRFDEHCESTAVPVFGGPDLSCLDDADAIVVADYARGVAAAPLIRERLDRLAGLMPIVWDPHARGVPPTKNVSLVTPNADEARRLSRVSGVGLSSSIDAADRLRREWGVAAVAVTLGQDGAVVSGGGHHCLYVPAPRQVAGDTCGAGDRFTASVATQLAAGADPPTAVDAAVDEACEFLAGGGVAAMGHAASVHRSSTSDWRPLVERIRSAGGTVVAAGGCFDLIHPGHLRTLRSARQLGDVLVVLINSDDSVRSLKGAGRPIVPQADRAEMLLALECVDAVVVFDEPTPGQALRDLRPDVWVKGADYLDARLPEESLLEAWHGRTVAIPLVPGRSTTALAAKLRSA
ncbi:PfkB family carbohydrate kinase [Kribbella sp. NPDC048928]|uniref:PfkB family carbohydrate kinase n=1 Tax=Kribbella sp. NPDC048928 TaxID=3364111 RepID=UPI00371BF5C4